MLETFPGFYLAGNLYRPTTPGGRRPVVMCPHGHWPEGRVNVDVQSRCVRLAQLGCVVYLYDMVGYADSKPFGHAFAERPPPPLGPEPARACRPGTASEPSTGS